MGIESDEGLAVVERAMARLALLEDVGDGDLSAQVVPASARAAATVRAREAGVLSGLGVACQVFRAVDPEVEITTWISPGERFVPGDRILAARGPARGLLTAERSALNFLQHLSGIATATARFIDAVRSTGSGVRVTDTRKTVPGLRLLAKEAVQDGGGVNHRLGLYDAVMIKDNHVEAAGGMSHAVRAARLATPTVPIIVEASNLNEAEEAARLDVGRILLDNMTPAQIGLCVRAIREIEKGLPPLEEEEERWIGTTHRPGDSRIQIEVSGGITLETAAQFALPGIDFLAVGEITHSAPAVDLAVDLELLD